MCKLIVGLFRSIGVFVLLAVCSCAFADGGVWTTKTPMPVAATSVVSGVIGGKLYVVAEYPSSQHVEIYDPATDSWTTGAAIPETVAYASGEVIDGKLYVVGGCSGSDCRIGITGTLMVYDSATDTWTTKSPMPTARFDAASGVMNGLLYVAGGKTLCSPAPCTMSNALEVYNPATNTWASKASMPTAMGSLGGAVLNGQLHVLGGTADDSHVLATHQVYDPATDTWSTLAPMPTARQWVGAVNLDGTLFAIGGNDTVNSDLTIVDAYDASTDSWTAMPSIPTGRTWAKPQAINDVIYVVGGGSSAIATNEAFMPTPVWVTENPPLVSAGYDHSCAVTSAGGVKCWGHNDYGQLGDSTTVDKHVPVSVTGLSSGVSQVVASAHYTCALTTGGGVKCWGFNGNGEIGDGTIYTTRYTPVDVVGLTSGVSAIAALGATTCALTTTGGVKCWGWNGDGEVGNGGTDGHYLSPQDVVGLNSGVSAIAAGGSFECALTDVGGVKCWGANYYGQLGNNTTTPSNTPVDVVGLSGGVRAIAGGAGHACALLDSGSVQCWGLNVYGQLGDNTTNNSPAPVNVVGLESGVSAIALGEHHSCAIMDTGNVKCWGWNNTGQLGDNTTVDKHTPVDVLDSTGLTPLGDIVAVSGGGLYLGAQTCAKTTTGSVKCWGYNGYGQLGNASTVDRHTPVNVIGFGAAAIKSDLDGDGGAEVLFLNTSTGATRYWVDAAKSQSIYVGTYSTTYNYQGSGDFDGDGRTDLLFMRASDNATLVWGGAVKTAASFPGTGATGFNVAAICDVDGDGRDDIIWYNATSGATRVWSGAVKTAVTYPGTQTLAYTIAACADFDGDGKADLFWHNAATGANQIWLGANKSMKLSPGNLADLTWTVIGAGDTDGDGKADFIWYRASSGGTQIWKGGLKSVVSYPGTGVSGFTPKAIGDYDSDGKADLLWGNDTTLATQIWRGVVKANAYSPGTSPSGFVIQK